MFNDVAMWCGDVNVMGTSCCLYVQWCGHVLSRCGVRVMGTVLDFELLSQCSMTWPCVVEMCVRVMGTVLDFELLSQCSMVWPCVVEMLWVIEH